MSSDSIRRKLIAFGVFVLPLALVKGAGTLLGGAGLADASGTGIKAAPIEPVEPTVDPPSWSWSAEEHAAAEHVAALRAESFGKTPFYYKETAKVCGTPTGLRRACPG